MLNVLESDAKNTPEVNRTKIKIKPAIDTMIFFIDCGLLLSSEKTVFKERKEKKTRDRTVANIPLIDPVEGKIYMPRMNRIRKNTFLIPLYKKNNPKIKGMKNAR